MSRKNKSIDLSFDPEIERIARPIRKQTKQAKEQAVGTPPPKKAPVPTPPPKKKKKENTSLEPQPFVMPDTPPPTPQTLKQYAHPTVADMQPGIQMPTTTATNFDIKSHVMNLIVNNQFAGMQNEDPNQHLQRFTQYCSLQKINGMEDKELYFRLFQFSLTGKALHWYNNLPNTVTSWK